MWRWKTERGGTGRLEFWPRSKLWFEWRNVVEYKCNIPADGVNSSRQVTGQAEWYCHCSFHHSINHPFPPATKLGTLMKKKIIYSSNIRKFRMEQLRSHIWLTASSYMTKYLCISSYIRKPFLIYDFATAPSWISLYMRKIFFSFYQCSWQVTGQAVRHSCCSFHHSINHSVSTSSKVGQDADQSPVI